jgi:EpsI family protein
MSSFSRNSLITACILIVAIAMTRKIQTSSAQVTEGSIDLEVVPYEINSWKGTDIPMSQDVYEILETDNVLFREYRDDSDYPVVLAIVYAKNNRDSFHPPEICYIGSGIDLIGKKFEKLTLSDGSSLNTTKLSMKSDTHWVTAWYWFMAGDKTMASYYSQQLSLLKNLFNKKPYQGALIRISIDGNDALGKEKASKFVANLMPYLNSVNHPESMR